VTTSGVALPSRGAAPGTGSVTAGGLLALRLLLAGVVLVVLAAAVTRVYATTTLAAASAGLVVVAGRRVLLAWPTLVGFMLLVILFIPIRRYTLAGGLPFSLEPYRIVAALILLVWLAAVLVDPAQPLRRTGFEGPVLILAVAVMLSLLTNPDRVSGVSAEVVKQVIHFTSFLAVMYLVASVIHRREALDGIIVLLVVSGTVLAVSSVYEWYTGVNVFNRLDRYVSVLEYVPDVAPATSERGGRPRAYASAQHAIALGALLVMLLPLAVYLYRRTARFVWMAAGGTLVLGALATGSRTAVVMLVASLLVFLWLKRQETVRLLPYLLPLAIVCQVVMPGTLGTLHATIAPKNGLVAEQYGGEGTGSGRLQDLGPSLSEWGRQPWVGQGYGTRLPSEDDRVRNALILDDQWLSSLLETGALGFIGLVWLFTGAVRRLRRLASHDDAEYGWLLTCLATSIVAYAVGMLTYDAFSFIQVTWIFFVILGLSAAALRIAPAGPARPRV